jgi:hypothetical protein
MFNAEPVRISVVKKLPSLNPWKVKEVTPE